MTPVKPAASVVGRISWLAAGTGILFGMVSLPEVVLYVPFAASLVFLGLPHGAVDHLVLLNQRGNPRGIQPFFDVCARYLAIATVYLLVWFITPLSAAAFFILITWFHWGQGDLYFSLASGRFKHLDSRFRKAAHILIRGALPMLVPLVAFPEVYMGVVRSMAERTALSAGPELTIPGEGFRILLAGGLLTFAATYFVVTGRALPAADRPGWRKDVFETSLLLVFFATVPPLFAVGLYFCLWHSLRHIDRLTADDDPRGLTRQGAAAAWGRFALRALPMTAASLGLLAGMYLLVPSTPATAAELIGVYLVLISVLTLPHVWVVCRMDIRDGIWRSDFRAAKRQLAAVSGS
jgi:beta-carotene 15,15'-dioxygenase